MSRLSSARLSRIRQSFHAGYKVFRGFLRPQEVLTAHRRDGAIGVGDVANQQSGAEAAQFAAKRIGAVAGKVDEGKDVLA